MGNPDFVMRRVLATGATGAVGPAVVRALIEEGWQVRALVRRDPPPDLLPAVVERVRGDLLDPASLRRAAEGVDAVLHMAALLHEQSGDARAMNVDATRTLVDAARGKRFVFFSTIAVYGPGGPFDEESPARPATEYARTKLEAEGIVLDAGGIVLRLPAVYGSRMKGHYATLVRALARGTFPIIGMGDNHRTLVHECDLAQAAVLALGAPAAGRLYNVTDGTTHAMRDIIGAIAAALGKSPPRLRVPLPLVRAAGVIVPKLGARLDKYLEEIRVDSSRIARELRFVPRYDLESGWRKALS
jgi:UDP-glucose 4-epimerase